MCTVSCSSNCNAFAHELALKYDLVQNQILNILLSIVYVGLVLDRKEH